MISKIQGSNTQPSFKAWLNLEGATELLSKKCTKEIINSAETVGDAKDIINIHISDTYMRNNSWSEMGNRFTVKEPVRETYMNAIVNSEHFSEGFETKEELSRYEIGANILKWLEKLPRYKD